MQMLAQARAPSKEGQGRAPVPLPADCRRLKTFFANMPTDKGMAFVLVQHLDPNHKSMLVDLLGAQTAMPVVEAKNRMAVAADRIFVIPPNSTMTIARGILHVSKPAPKLGQ
jgi:two-component system CheB/CheR fusion protein